MHDADILVNLWRALPRRDGGPLPRRSDLSIGAVAPFLSYCFQASWHDGRALTIDFMGERLIEAWGRDPTGLNLLKELPAYEARRMEDLNRLFFNQPCGTMITRRLQKGEGGEYGLTNWSLPMLDRDGAPTVIFGMSRIVRERPERPYSGKLSFIGSDVVDGQFIDLGYGVPLEMPMRASA